VQVDGETEVAAVPSSPTCSTLRAREGSRRLAGNDDDHDDDHDDDDVDDDDDDDDDDDVDG